MNEKSKKRIPIRSSINYIRAYLIGLPAFIIHYILRKHFPFIAIDILSYLTYYLILSFTISYLEIFENQLRIVYPLKIFYRYKVYEYKSLIKAIDIVYNHIYEDPRIKLVFANTFKFEWSSNTFPVHSYAKRREILSILKSKGIEIEVRTDNHTEMNILS